MIRVETRRTSSRLKRTPPIGAPKATETPAADAAERTWEETKVGHKTNLRTKKNHFSCFVMKSPLVSHLSFLGFIFAVFRKEVREDVPTAAGHVDQRALFPQTEARGYSQHQGDGLDHQRPLPQVASDDEATQDGFDLCGVKKCEDGHSWTSSSQLLFNNYSLCSVHCTKLYNSTVSQSNIFKLH